ncbi:nucleoside-diphosphate-sugar epimerase [Deinococcus metalli]|uniref:Nucleoside-diphosphate-sugar epimerase n=1 Tax=Deinococcus metalli TaxID=1141878 RepID=A0A7W8NQZ7_9DEIO|nr:NAD(P)-dependent oxidoreductase [Deinococcus metalli]MBB5375607.1 nucleoside-diphosphate-sugar epimerase [Deinococcus metalli]GHF38424.1 snoG protein [Deinococcus metalli]
MTAGAPHDSPVLLLGAAGFLGQHVAATLRAAGRSVREVRGVDLAGLDDRAWDDLMAGTAGVVNAAGRTAGTLSDLTRANVLLLAGALDAAAHAGVPLVHLASAAEYGRTPDGHAAREDGLATPLSAYGASKLAGTLLLQQAVHGGHVRACALRVTNPLGHGMGAGTLPGRAAQQVLAAGTAPLRFGPLGAQRDFVDARDVARAAVHVLDLLGAGHTVPDVINVGSGEARPVRDVVHGLAALAGHRGPLLEDAPGSPRSGDVPYQRADLTRLHATGFTAQHTFDSSVMALLGPVPAH